MKSVLHLVQMDIPLVNGEHGSVKMEAASHAISEKGFGWSSVLPYGRIGFLDRV